jgi:flagella basal body P-ring formation protein FlgA
MIALHCLELISLLASPSCLAVANDRVLAADLVAVAPSFAGLPPELPLTFAPLPGTQRVLQPRELLNFLRRSGVEPTAPLPQICVQRKTAQLNEADLAAAIKSALDVPDLHVQILDYPRQVMPQGTIQFKTDALTSHPPGGPEQPVIWPGRLLYDGRNSVSIWVKAVLWVERKVVVAAVDLSPGETIRPESVRLEQVREFPLGNRSANSLAQVAGLKSRSLIRKGEALSLARLELPWTILKGDKVLVRVLAGATHVTLEALALSSGRLGDEVTLRNPESGRAFRAVVEAQGMAFLKQRDIL